MPPIAKSGNAEFKDKDWRTTTVGDVTDPELVRFAELETSVEDATNVCPQGSICEPRLTSDSFLLRLARQM